MFRALFANSKNPFKVHTMFLLVTTKRLGIAGEEVRVSTPAFG